MATTTEDHVIGRSEANHRADLRVHERLDRDTDPVVGFMIDRMILGGADAYGNSR
ncbi:hypothetical protein [Kutzneria sp. NPDC051319]|uniref:hypothetical protein n=1 Tax=Kutzneria sp. NPDC051319 TaxID=3155047 RepID=UPI0034330DF7